VRNDATKSLMPLSTLKQAVIWALKNNLSIQYLLPSYSLPKEYETVISSYEHNIIAPLEIGGDSTICIVDSTDDRNDLTSKTLVARMTIDELSIHIETLKTWITQANRLNIIIEDVKSFNSDKEKNYETTLMRLADTILDEFISGKNPSVNILTDRLHLDMMNNCNAGIDFVSIAPDGKFYLCPAFYGDNDAIGSLENGLQIKNPQLLQIDHSPICRTCDAYHCKRCVWLNKHTTLEINTPSHEQCVMSHIERNVSAYISSRLYAAGIITKEQLINKTNCLDPFYKLPRIQLR